MSAKNRRKDEQIDIHGRERQLASALNSLKQSSISEKKRKLIEDFVQYKAQGDAPSILRQVKYYLSLPKLLSGLSEDLKKTKQEDIRLLFDSLDKEYDNPHTRIDKRIVLKTFFKWLLRDEDKAKKLFKTTPNPKIKKVNLRTTELLLWNECVAMSRCCKTLKEVAFIQSLWDSGCRLEELMSMKVCDVESVYNGRGVVLHVRRSKTDDGIRAVAVPLSAASLTQYLNKEHPLKDDGNAPLFLRKYNGEYEALTDRWGNKVIREAASRAKIKGKKINPHSFRKASVSYYAQFMNDTQLKARYGWVADTKVLRCYVARNEDQANMQAFAAAGVVDMKVEAPANKKGNKCLYCGEENPAGWTKCIKCQATLEPDKIVTELEEIRQLDEKWQSAKKLLPSDCDSVLDMLMKLFEKVEALEKQQPRKLVITPPA